MGVPSFGIWNSDDVEGRSKADEDTARGAYQNSLDSRDQQHSLGGSLYQLAVGGGKSAADMMLDAQREQNERAALSMAASARGGNTGLAGYQAMNAASDANASATYQASLLRAQEELNYYQMLAQLYGQQRQGDLAGMGAWLGSSTTLEQAQLQAQSAQAQAEAQKSGAALSALGALGGAAIRTWG